MKTNPFILFFISLAITTVIVGFIALLFFFLTFNLAGGETLNQMEDQNIAQLIVSILILFIAILFARYYFKNNRKYSAWGIIVFPLIVAFVATVYLFEQNYHHTKFDKAIWEQAKWKPEKMAKTLVKDQALIGMTRKQIKEMLGEGSGEYQDSNSNIGSISYLVRDEWTLTIFFQKDKVVEVVLRLPYLGV